MDNETAVEIIEGLLEEALEKVDIKYIVENDGIGPYEYWGFKGVDHGTNYITIEENSFVTVKTVISNRLLEKVADYLIDQNHMLVGFIQLHEDREIKAYGKIVSYSSNIAEVTFEICWEPAEKL